MSIITWNDNFSVGIRQFDDEHKELIEIINKLYMAMKNGNSKAVMSETLEKLIKHILKHFANEEQLMLRKKYPFYEEHKRDHDEFSHKITEYKKLHQQKILHATQLMRVLRNWIINHICEKDRKYGAYLK